MELCVLRWVHRHAIIGDIMATIKIGVSRIGYHYYHQRTVGGVAFPEVPVKRDRAMEIISEWPEAADQKTDFGPDACEWYWTAQTAVAEGVYNG